MPADNNGSENGGCSTLLSIAFISVPVAIIGGSGYGLYLGTTRYLNGTPVASQEVLLPILISILFLGGLASFASRVRFGETTEPPEDAPWKARSIWQTEEIPETGLSVQRVITTVVWNLFAIPFSAFVLYKVVWTAAERGWGLYVFSAFILLLPAIGLWLVWSVVKEGLHRWKFGPSTLVMKTMPARLGRTLRARVRTSLNVDQVPSEGVHVELACYRRKRRGNSTRYVQHWNEEKYVNQGAVSRGPDGAIVPVSFDIPSGQPASSRNPNAKRIMWTVTVNAALSGLNYDASFEIPVFPPDEQRTA